MTTQNNSILSHLVPNTEEAEQKYIGYLLSNPTEAYLIQVNEYSNFIHRTIIESLLELQEKSMKIDYDSLLLLCKKKSESFDSEVLYKIFNQPKNFENIDLFKKEIVEGSIKRKTLLQLENLLISTTNKKFFDINDFQNILQKLLETSFSLEDTQLLNGKQMKELYQKTRDKRKSGIAQRSLGYDILHKTIRKPAESGEMTGIVGQKGGGKSIFVKNIEQKLISKGTCIISINLEMTLDSNMDRFQCLKTGFPLELILSNENNPREQAQIERALNSWDNIDNYLYYNEPTLTLNQLDGLIYKSKLIFKRRGVLPDDGYCIITLDLVTMMSEFSEAKSALEIEGNVNKLHSIIKKHNIHGIPILQANENKMRGAKVFKNPDELNFYKVGLEDVKNSAAWSERCRVICTLTRPLQLKKRFFPEQNELWNLETDLMNINIVKQNDGPEGFHQFVLGQNFRIYPFVKDENELK